MKVKKSIMKNGKSVEENLVSLIAKIGEKITIGRSKTIKNIGSKNFVYLHTVVKDNLSKLAVVTSLETKEKSAKIDLLGKQLSMHIAASSPLSIDKDNLDQKVLKKEMEIIKEELKNSGKDDKIIDKIALGKLNKFISENTLLNQEWIMEPKKKVKDIIKSFAAKEKIVVKKFVRFKVGEGV